MDDIGGLFCFFWIVAIPVLLIGYVVWGGQKKKLGTIRCNRCHHVGTAKGLFMPFRGIKPVCDNCQSKDWVKVQSPKKSSANHSTSKTLPRDRPIRQSNKADIDAVTEIGVTCPVCNDAYSVNLGLAGKTIKCRKCEERIRIPDDPRTKISELGSHQSDGPLAMDEVMEVLPANDDAVEPRQGNSRLRPCPDCGTMISKRASACPSCGCPSQCL